MGEHLKNQTDFAEINIVVGQPNLSISRDRQLLLFTGDATKNKIKLSQPNTEITYLLSRRKERDDDFRLTIFHLNDLHGQLAYFNGQGEEAVFSRIYSAIRLAHEKASKDAQHAVLTITAGDDCIGGLFDVLLDDELNESPTHASYQAYSHSGVDLSVLGNHDFDFGVRNLANAIKRDANFPILAANLTNCPTLDGLYYPAALFVVKGFRIGVIGLVTSAETKMNCENIGIVNPVPVAKRLVALLDPLCDVIILATHLGLSTDTIAALTADAGDVELARSLKNKCVQLIIGGHSHDVLNLSGLDPRNIVNGIPIVQAGSMGHFLGRVDLRVSTNNASVTDAHLIATETLPIDTSFDDEVMQPLIRKTREKFSKSIGVVEDDPHLSTDYIRNNFSSGEMTLSNFITDGLAYQLRKAGQQIDLVMIDSSSIQQGLNLRRQITIGDWFKLMPFTDTVRFYQVTGKELIELLQDNAYRINRLDEPNTERGFLHFSSDLNYKIELGKTRHEATVSDMNFQGISIEQQLDRLFIIASTNFVRELSKNWELCDDLIPDCELLDLHQFPHFETDYFVRRELIQYILEVGGVTKKAGASLDGRLKIMKNV